MEPLLPSLRKRKRYLAIEILSDSQIQRASFISAVSSSGCALFGEAGYSKFGVTVLGFEDNLGIVKCLHTSVSETIAVLAFITNIDGQPVLIRTAGVSGTIKGAEIKFLKNLKSGI
jgi:RNase P/RNase MRP subunit POP5